MPWQSICGVWYGTLTSFPSVWGLWTVVSVCVKSWGKERTNSLRKPGKPKMTKKKKLFYWYGFAICLLEFPLTMVMR